MRKLLGIFILSLMIGLSARPVQAGESNVEDNTYYAVKGENENDGAIVAQIEERVQEFINAGDLNVSCLDEITVGHKISLYNIEQQIIIEEYPIYKNNECVLVACVTGEDDICVSTDVGNFKNADRVKGAALFYVNGGITYAETKEALYKLKDNSQYIDYEENNKFNNRTLNSKIKHIQKIFECELEKEGYTESATSTEITCNVNYNTSFYNAKNEVWKLGIVASTGLNTSIGPYGTTVACNITQFVKQGNYNLCWAACVATIVNYKREAVKGDDNYVTAKKVAKKMDIGYNDGATIDTTAEALNEYKVGNYKTMGHPNFSNVKKWIDKDNPFVLALSSGSMGHAVTGYGYSLSQNKQTISIWDPNNNKLSFKYKSSGSTVSLYGYTWEWFGTAYK